MQVQCVSQATVRKLSRALLQSIARLVDTLQPTVPAQSYCPSKKFLQDARQSSEQHA